MEIERKFLVNYTPDLNSSYSKDLVQGYLSFEPEIRIRSMNNEEFYLASKSDGNLSRDEIEPSINSVSFQILTNLIQGRKLEKTRYYIPLYSDLIAEFDIYHDELEGLLTVEVEFKSEEDANKFVIPDWFGKEITYDKRYKNKNLARCSVEELKILLGECNEVKKVRK